MSEPLVDATEAELGDAIAENLYALFRSMTVLPGARIEEWAGGSRHLALPGSPMFKGAWATRFTGEEADEEIAETAEWFRAEGAPFAFWWVDRNATPADLGERLVRPGWAHWELDAPGMAAPLDGLRYELTERVPAGYVQDRVVDAPGLVAFEEVFREGFGVPAWAGRAWVEATLELGVDRAPWQFYVGRLDERPVATTIAFNGGGVASVFGVATVPDARGRGIGAAITLLAYDEARRLGYRHGVLFATELGAPVYERIGFRDVGAGISRYLWRADG